MMKSSKEFGNFVFWYGRSTGNTEFQCFHPGPKFQSGGNINRTAKGPGNGKDYFCHFFPTYNFELHQWFQVEVTGIITL